MRVRVGQHCYGYVIRLTLRHVYSSYTLKQRGKAHANSFFEHLFEVPKRNSATGAKSILADNLKRLSFDPALVVHVSPVAERIYAVATHL